MFTVSCGVGAEVSCDVDEAIMLHVDGALLCVTCELLSFRTLFLICSILV